MTRPIHIRGADLRGLASLAVDATVGLAELVESLHATIAHPLSRPGAATVRAGVTGLVYRTIGGTTRLVGKGLDFLFEQLALRLDRSAETSPEREAVLAALNGVLGDTLVARQNPLAIAMTVRCNGLPVTADAGSLRAAFPKAAGRLAIFVHGLCMNDRQWQRGAHDHGAALAREHGYVPLYLHYNTGRHVAENGRALSALLDSIIGQWPCAIEELVIVAHSMGGLVVRSACHYGVADGWLRHLRKVVFLGTPHFGAPLERAGHWIDVLLGSNRYSAPFARLGRIRSAAITDMRHGSLLDEDTAQGDRISPRVVPLPAGVDIYLVAASRGVRPRRRGGRQSGDGLVPVNSALGIHRSAALTLPVPPSHRYVRYGIGHLDLLGDLRVYRRISRWLAA